MADENAPSARNVLGHSSIFTPEVIDDIHVKSELGRYRMRGFSMFKKIPHWDDLMFMPGTLTRFVIEGYREKCTTKTVLGARFAANPIQLDIPVYITGMSFRRGAFQHRQRIFLRGSIVIRYSPVIVVSTNSMLMSLPIPSIYR